jgi:hypothetical protein
VPLSLWLRACLRDASGGQHVALACWYGRQHGGRQDNLVGTVGPGQHLGQALFAVLAVHGGTGDLAALVADHGFFLASLNLQAAGEHVVLAVTHERSEGTVLEAALARAGLGE